MLWLIGAGIALLLLRVFFWIAIVAIGAWLIYVLRYPILVVLGFIWKAVAFIARSMARLFKRRPAAPKLITHAETSTSD